MRATYEQMARDLGLDYCDRCRIFDHQSGEAQVGIVHLNDARFSWPGAKRFLRLCAIALDPTLREEEPFWLYLYRLNIAARDVGVRVHLKVPRRYFRLDRMFVLAGVAGLSNEVPMRKQAFDWARR
ncbi:MAG: hypothetical protein RJA59_1266 [Pseudomonadota bacterium]